jgi:hypothetical protein
METSDLSYSTLVMADAASVRRLARWLGLKPIRNPAVAESKHVLLCRRIRYWLVSSRE